MPKVGVARSIIVRGGDFLGEPCRRHFDIDDDVARIVDEVVVVIAELGRPRARCDLRGDSGLNALGNEKTAV